MRAVAIAPGVLFVALLGIGLGLVSSAAEAQPTPPDASWFQPNRARTVPQHDVTRPGSAAEVMTLGETLACPSARNLIYFYRAALDLADPEVIEDFANKHRCEILQRGARYRLLGWGSVASGIVVGTTPMYVRTDAILGQ